jgi:hypothetical protein
MTNKYLTKISGLVGGIIKPVYGAVKDVVGSVGKDALKSAHKAIGGGFRDLAASKGVTSQHTLRGIKDPRSYLKAMRKHQGPSIISPATKTERHSIIKDLQKEQKKAIVKTVGYTGAVVYGGNKILDKIKGNEQPQYY